MLNRNVDCFPFIEQPVWFLPIHTTDIPYELNIHPDGKAPMSGASRRNSHPYLHYNCVMLSSPHRLYQGVPKNNKTPERTKPNQTDQCQTLQRLKFRLKSDLFSLEVMVTRYRQKYLHVYGCSIGAFAKICD